MLLVPCPLTLALFCQDKQERSSFHPLSSSYMCLEEIHYCEQGKGRKRKLAWPDPCAGRAMAEADRGISISFMEARLSGPQPRQDTEDAEQGADLEGEGNKNGTQEQEQSSGNVWGTWEELLLASAVKKHGTDNWTLVSAELQARSHTPLSAFAPEACRVKYLSIEDRYSSLEREGYPCCCFFPACFCLPDPRFWTVSNFASCFRNGHMPWFEELRRLRVSQLKRELKHFDSSIPSLENKLKRLEAERDKSTQICPLVGESPSQVESQRSSNTTEVSSLKQANKVHSPTPPVIIDGTVTTLKDEKLSVPELVAPDKSEFAKNDLAVADHEPESKVGGPKDEVADAGVKEAEVEVKPIVSSESLLRISDSDLDSSKCSRDYLVKKPEVGLGFKVQAENGHEAVVKKPGSPLAPANYRSVSENDNAVFPESLVTQRQLDSLTPCDANGARSTGLQVSVNTAENGRSLPAPQPEGITNGSNLQVDPPAGLVQASSRVKQQQNAPHDGPISGMETRFQADERQDTSYVASDRVPALDVKPVVPVESGDSTELFKREVSSAAHDTKHANQGPPCAKDAPEKPGSEDATSKPVAPEIKIENNSREACTSSRHVDSDTKLQSTSSTENSELHEVWGESAEAGDPKGEQTRKRGRLTGWGKRRNLSKRTSIGPSSIVKEERDVGTPTETSVKTESMTTSHEGSDSLQFQRAKPENEYDTEAWHQMERSGDSRVERSEVGSFVDGNEDISPMSRRNRREPKVSGKLLPLLESLRTICGHKCAPWFKHNQESQDNPRYDSLIRAPLDLGLIRSRLEEGRYPGSMHFFRDLLLMVNNALVYYPRESPESSAASGLRECIVKEMAGIFETEALLKQEGPSFRKRDAGKARQPSVGMHGKKKGLKRSSASDTTIARDLPVRSSTSTDSRSNVNLSVAKEVGLSAKAVGDAKTELGKGTSDMKYFTKGVLERVPKSSDEAKTRHSDNVATRKASDLREPESSKQSNVVKSSDTLAGSKDAKKGGATASGNISRSPAVPPANTSKSGSLSKPAPVGSNKDLKSGISRANSSIRQTDALQEPVKRGVGRPPKHSQQQTLKKAKQIETPDLPRKRARR